MKTFERIYEAFPAFLDRVAAGSPDFVVPVARKGCKLLRASAPSGAIRNVPVRYRTFFELHPGKLKGAKVAVLDDATQHTATLLDYRHFFERLGADVETFSFVGHDTLRTGTRWMLDPKTHVEVFLTEPLYQEYLLQQAAYLLSTNSHFDLDHLVLRYDLPKGAWCEFATAIKRLGCLLHIEDVLNGERAPRFALTDVSFFESSPFLTHSSINLGAIRKLKFVINSARDTLFFSPLVFPTWCYDECRHGEQLLSSVPFDVPFPEALSKRNENRSHLLKAYFNIRFVAMASFAKAFAQELNELSFSTESLVVRSTDLDSVLGPATASKLSASLKSFLSTPIVASFCENRGQECQPIKPKRKYRSFAQLIDHAKRTYESKVKKHRTRVGVHHFIAYDELATAFKDKLLLDEGLDFFCDLGVLVPETVVHRGRIERACRTGEPIIDYPWERTGVIVPLAIDQLNRLSKEGDSTTPPMALDKALACFAFDYPMRTNQQLHCMTSRPYTFGAFVHLYHSLRASQMIPIHVAARHAKYFRIVKGNRFQVVDRVRVYEAVRDLFDERQEVPFSEIATYFSMLSMIATLPGKVENLNALSICREENYFYSHILYNLRSWVTAFGESLNETDPHAALDALRKASTEISSARSKMSMGQTFPTLMANVRKEVLKDMQFIMAWQRVESSYRPFTNDFRQRMKRLGQIVELESVLSAYCMACATDDAKRWSDLQKTDWKTNLTAVGVNVSGAVEGDGGTHCYSRVLTSEGYDAVLRLLASLPNEEPLLATLLSMHALERAKNVATNFVRKHGLQRVVLVFLDLSGLRDVPEPKDTVVSQFYTIVDTAVANRIGFTISGGRGGDDEYTILFTDVRIALEFAKDVKQQFEQNLLLANYDIKFGMTVPRVQGPGGEEALVRAWGEAKDACTFKTSTLKNRSELLIPHSTYNELLADVSLDAENLFQPFFAGAGAGQTFYKYLFAKATI